MSTTYSLVFQFAFESLEAFDLMIQLEDRMHHMANTGELGTVDGHDAGSSEMNIFVLTARPEMAYEQLAPIVELFFPDFKAAFRDVNGEIYTVLRPIGDKSFSVS